MKILLIFTVLFLACHAQDDTLCTTGNLTVCLTKVRTKLREVNPTFLPSNASWSPSHRLDVKLTSAAMSFQSCCKAYTYAKKDDMINPFVSTGMEAVYLRTAPSISVNGAAPPMNKSFTLMMVDKDASNASIGTTAKPVVHWLVVNIKGLVSTGVTLLPYQLPAPMDDTSHTFFFMLYEQVNTTINTTALNMTAYSTGCPSARCLFEVKKFATDTNAELCAVNWAKVMKNADPYINYMEINGGSTEAAVCANVTGYANPCQTGGATVVSGTALMSAILVFISLMFV